MASQMIITIDGKQIRHKNILFTKVTDNHTEVAQYYKRLVFKARERIHSDRKNRRIKGFFVTLLTHPFLNGLIDQGLGIWPHSGGNTELLLSKKHDPIYYFDQCFNLYAIEATVEKVSIFFLNCH